MSRELTILAVFGAIFLLAAAHSILLMTAEVLWSRWQHRRQVQPRSPSLPSNRYLRKSQSQMTRNLWAVRLRHRSSPASPSTPARERR